jgi:hypothetical protein
VGIAGSFVIVSAMSPDRRDIETIQVEHGTHCGVLPAQSVSKGRAHRRRQGPYFDRELVGDAASRASMTSNSNPMITPCRYPQA